MERAFRLAGLLRLREMQEERAAGVLAVSHGALRAATDRQTATLTTLARHAMPAAADAAAWRTAVVGRGALTHLLADAAIEVRDAGTRVAADTADWSAARSRSVALEKLRDRHRTLVRVEDERAEQVALDEIASRRAAASAAASSAAASSAAPLAAPAGRHRPTTTARTTTRTPEGSRA